MSEFVAKEMGPGEAWVDRRKGSTPAAQPGATGEALPFPMSVLICGSQPLYRAALVCLIERDERFRTAAETTVAYEDVQRALTSEIQMVLIDYDLHVESGHDLSSLERLLDLVSPLPALIVSSGMDSQAVQTALKHGISGIVSKGSSGDVLLAAMDSAQRGQVWLDRTLLTQMFDDSAARKAARGEQTKIDQLTRREREIVTVACTGLSNKQIAEKLSISEATVRHHLGSIFAKLGVSTRSELVVYGYRNKLASASVMP